MFGRHTEPHPKQAHEEKMMGEMVERVAEAIARGRSEGGRKLFVGWANLDPYDKDMWRSAARAAIEAMREPTVDMAEAGDRSFERDEDSSGDYRIYDADAGKCWRVMVDKALA
jgi:hypothetical protein